MRVPKQVAFKYKTKIPPFTYHTPSTHPLYNPIIPKTFPHNPYTPSVTLSFKQVYKSYNINLCGAPSNYRSSSSSLPPSHQATSNSNSSACPMTIIKSNYNPSPAKTKPPSIKMRNTKKYAMKKMLPMLCPLSETGAL